MMTTTTKRRMMTRMNSCLLEVVSPVAQVP
uniref:Uncharacterized protein n=1 Tax=Rhizophora mucronata TaxID=61149 RepID=A0A2P2NJ49_RHIMU